VDQLKNYVELERTKGFSDTQIRQALLKAGHNSMEVDAALKHSQGISRYVYIAFALIVIGLIAGSVYFWQSREVYRGYDLMREGKYDEARNLFMKRADSDPKYMMGMAVLSYREGDIQNAEKYASDANKAQGFSDARIILAKIYSDSGENEKAIQVLQDGHQTKCTSLILLGLFEQKKGKSGTAYYQQATSAPECQTGYSIFFLNETQY